MCSLCITSITNINARLSAGGRGRTRISVRSVCTCVAVMCKCVHLVCICVPVRTVRRIRYEDSLRQTWVDVIHAAQRRKCILSLGTINTEVSKQGERVGV